MSVEFKGEIWYWKGPAPFYFVTVPAKESRELKEICSFVTYGWGMIPVRVRVGETEWTTAMFPKDGRYVLPLKDAVRKAEKLEAGDAVTIWLEAEKR